MHETEFVEMRQGTSLSFIITVISPENAVQISDTRISSLANQSLITDEQRKSLIVRGKKAHFMLGWIGLACTDGGHNTADWLFKTLFEMNAVELPIDDIVQHLRTSATAHFASLKARDKRSVFVIAGWQQSEPFLCIVSNYVSLNATNEIHDDAKHRIPSFSEADVAAPEFLGWSEHFKKPRKEHFLVNVMGDFVGCKLDRHFSGLKNLLKKRADASKVSTACRQIALKAASHSPKTIGRNLIGVEMDSGGRAKCSFYSEDGAEAVLVPPVLSPEGCSTESTIRIVISGDEVITRLHAKIARRKVD